MSHSYSLRSKNPISYGEQRIVQKNANEALAPLGDAASVPVPRLGDAASVLVPRANSELSAPLASQAASDGSWAVTGALLDNRNIDAPEGESHVRKSGTGSGMPRRHGWSPELGRSPAPRNEELDVVWRAVAQAREVVTGVENRLKGLAQAMNVPSHVMLNPAEKEKNVDPHNWRHGDLGIVEQKRELKFYKSTTTSTINETMNSISNPKRLDETERLHHELKKLKKQYKDSKRKKEQMVQRSMTPLSNELESKIIQATASASFKRSREERVSRSGRDGRHSFTPLRRDPLRPSNQIAPNSFLSQAFEGVGGPTRRKSDGKVEDRHGDAEGESTPSSSSENDPDSGQSPAHDDDGSEPSSESSRSSGDESDSSRSRHRRRRRHRRHRRRHSRTPRKPIIAPTPPEKYDGAADVAKFYRFVTEGQAYLKEGKVKPKAQVQKLAKHLTEKAQHFYTTEVIYDLAQWDTQKFFTELFNYCFPADFRLKQQRRLDGLRQGNWTVREFANELKLMFRTVGHIETHEKVMKLWLGLNKPLQRALWIESLDPQLSSWDDVFETAERHERTLNLGNEQQNLYQGGSSSPGIDSFGNDSTGSNSEADDMSPTLRPTTQSSDPMPRLGDAQLKMKQMSEQHKETHRAEGRCFECGETGHLARNCRKARTIMLPATGSSRNSFRTSNLTQLGDHTEQLNKISAAMIETAEEGDGTELDPASATLELWSIHWDIEIDGVSNELNGDEGESTSTFTPRPLTPTDATERQPIGRTPPLRGFLASCAAGYLADDKEAIFTPGTENTLSDVLSSLYSYDSPGTVRTTAEYAKYDGTATMAAALSLGLISPPVLVGLEARAVTSCNDQGHRLVLHRPCERTEGGDGNTTPNNPNNVTAEQVVELVASSALLEYPPLACHIMDITADLDDDAVNDVINFGDVDNPPGNEEPAEPAAEQPPSSRSSPPYSSLPLPLLPFSSRISGSNNQEPSLTVNPTQLTLFLFFNSFPDGSFNFGPFCTTSYPQPFPQLPFVFSRDPGFCQICDHATNNNCYD